MNDTDSLKVPPVALDSYRAPEGTYDELQIADGTARPEYARLLGSISELSGAELNNRADTCRRLVHEQGITYDHPAPGIMYHPPAGASLHSDTIHTSIHNNAYPHTGRPLPDPYRDLDEHAGGYADQPSAHNNVFGVLAGCVDRSG